ncbi:MAG: lycopene cyclase domain-containing protein [Ramlibacter sp.]
MASAPADFKYVWLIWASAFMLPWVILYAAAPAVRQIMVRASIPTAAFGLTQPIFVPRYWNPPTLFDLAQRTGFDIESLIFCFAIGGIGAASYRVLALLPEAVMDHSERQSGNHRWHLAALTAPFLIFLLLLLFPWNPIYPGILALFSGALAAGLCRPDLIRNSLWGGAIFFVLYLVFLLGLRWYWPGYIEAVWNLAQLLPWRPLGLPLEELLFGFGFGLYWSCVYEHLGWQRGASGARQTRPWNGAVPRR